MCDSDYLKAKNMLTPWKVDEERAKVRRAEVPAPPPAPEPLKGAGAASKEAAERSRRRAMASRGTSATTQTSPLGLPGSASTSQLSIGGGQ